MKKINTFIAAAIATALMASACTSGANETGAVQSQETVQSSQAAASSDAACATSDTSGVAGTQSAASQEPSSDDFFANHANTYYMSSGVGGWGASLTINADGTFNYDFHDSDANIVYTCVAHGSFGNVTQTGDHTYSVEVAQLTYDQEPDSTWTEDSDGFSIDYQSTTTEDLSEGCVLTFYEAGINTADLPEGYLIWYTSPRAMQASEIPAQFPCDGIYNEASERGFICE